MTRDQNVTLIYESSGLYLTIRGKALEGGTEGDAVTVLNLQSKRTVSGVVIGRGTSHETKVPKGATVLAAFASAMMDPRRVADPKRFDHMRAASDYIHFGYDLHQCFGIHINQATLHLMLKPLLQRPNLRRAPGKAGHLTKNGPFAESLVVEWG